MGDSVCWANVEVWQRLPHEPLDNRVKSCSYEGHFDNERLDGFPPPPSLTDLERSAAKSEDIERVTTSCVLAN